MLTGDGRKDKEHSQHTIGVEFSSRTINIGEKKIKLQVSSMMKRTEHDMLNS